MPRQLAFTGDVKKPTVLLTSDHKDVGYRLELASSEKPTVKGLQEGKRQLMPVARQTSKADTQTGLELMMHSRLRQLLCCFVRLLSSPDMSVIWLERPLVFPSPTALTCSSKFRRFPAWSWYCSV